MKTIGRHKKAKRIRRMTSSCRTKRGAGTLGQEVAQEHGKGALHMSSRKHGIRWQMELLRQRYAGGKLTCWKYLPNRQGNGLEPVASQKPKSPMKW